MKSLLRPLLHATRKSRRVNNQRFRRLTMEQLEGRRMLATDFVINVSFPAPTSGSEEYTAEQMSLIEAAADRWEEIITGIPVEPGVTYALDLAADIGLVDWEGTPFGSSVARGGFTSVSAISGLPDVGRFRYDATDINSTTGGQSFFDIALHEVGHALGLGTLWGTKGLLNGAETRYIGARAVQEFNAIFGTSDTSITVVDSGGHWSESVMGVEIMTPTAQNAANPISRITAGSLIDMGYTVDFDMADNFGPGFASVSIVPQVGNAPFDADQNEGTGGGGSRSFGFLVNRTGDRSGDTTINYVVAGSGTNPADAADFTGALFGTFTVAANDEFDGLFIPVSPDSIPELDDEFTVTISSPTNDAGVTTTLAPLATTALGTIRNDDGPPPSVEFTVAAQSGDEDVGTLTITAMLSATSTGDVTVPFTLGGTALGGVANDYAITLSPITILAGSDSADITITVNNDGDPEGDETVIVTMGTPTNATLGTTTVHTATINANDTSLPTVEFTAEAQSGDESVGTRTIIAMLSTTATSDVTVPFTLSGSATEGAGNDYTITASPITIASGTNSANITITVNDDADPEGDETVIVTLGTPTGATLGTTVVHTATINANDTTSLPTVEFTADAQSGDEDVGTLTITAMLSATATSDVTVPFSLGGTATEGAGNDYTITTTPITIASGTDSASITISVNDDADPEGDETVIVTLGTPTGATLGTTTVHTATISDDDCPTTVTNTNDFGAGSLRAAILCSNLVPGVQTIDFAIPGVGPHTIQPLTALPAITDPVVIDGTTQPGYTTTPVIELNGSSIVGPASGLSIGAGSSTVRGFAINRFSAAGIVLHTAGGNTLEGIYVGTGVTGVADLGNGGNGLVIVDSGSNVIGGPLSGARNVFSGNGHMGIAISGATSTNNTITNSAIGSDVTGLLPLANDQHGVVISGAANNTVGAATFGGSNTISGNTLSGVYITGAGATGNSLLSNYIGVRSNGSTALANGRNGVELRAGQNVVGGSAAGEGNTISGNTRDGVAIIGAVATTNSVEGNGIGTNEAETSAIANGRHGVFVGDAPNNTISDNTISGNMLSGVLIFGTGATGNALTANRIGTDAAATADIGNTLSGVDIFNASGNTIGGTTAADGNTIAFNKRGVRIASGTTNTIIGNPIFSNDLLGIDLGGDGRTANDAGDPDPGPNLLQNFPEFGPVVLRGTDLEIEYSVPAAVGAFPLRIEFFIADASNQEGRTLLGSDTYASAGTKQITIPAGAATGASRIIATATDTDGNTSEFSISRGISVAAGGAASGSLQELATIDAIFAGNADDEL